ncbi:MAG: o-succinylbenzoate synthase [Deltaproteobacteria bacterium]|nr:o-succinylbenzoate synthase [Deltaproteobacteria bacterium]
MKHRTRRYAHRLGHGVANARHSWSIREGLILELETQTGLVGQGEAAPLPGHSVESLDEVEASLNALRFERRLDDGFPGGAKEGISRYISELEGRLPPSAAFAVETALFDLLGHHHRASVADLLNAASSVETGTATLVPRLSADDMRTIVRRASQEGTRTFKLKVGALGLDEDLALARMLREIAGPYARIRLDGNQSIAPTDVGSWLDRSFGIDPEFFEEPTSLDGLEALEESPVPLAIDESLREPARALSLLDRSWLRAVVIKPMVLGGLLPALEIANIVRGQGLDVVVSHLFDGPVAHAAASCLALSVASDEVDAGLGLHDALRAWPQALYAHIDGAIVRRPEAAPFGLGLPRVFELLR